MNQNVKTNIVLNFLEKTMQLAYNANFVLGGCQGVAVQ